MKKHRVLYIVIAVLLISVFIISCINEITSPWTWAQNIKMDDIIYAIPWDNFDDKSSLTEEEKEILVSILNGLERKDFTKNTELVGGTPEYGLKVLTLNSDYNINESIAPAGALEMTYCGHLWWIDSNELDTFILNTLGKTNIYG
ncbi:MAG: hypothetical protein HFE90_06075 [Firmicutes bacterium]|nr:hypothetical protein [Bacillota bacterium]